MNQAELGQRIVDKVNLFKGHTTGLWEKTGFFPQMTAEFANVGQATMFAQFTIWDLQLTATVSGGSWDDSTIPAQVTIKPGISGR